MKIIQISDTHLQSKPTDLLFEVNTYDNLKKVITYLKSNISDIDAFLLTGDLSQDGTHDSYEHIAALFDFDLPIYWINGNHDKHQNMRTVLSSVNYFNELKQTHFHNWHIITANTVKEPNDDGFMTSESLTQLRTALLDAKTKPNEKVALVMHHHPVSVKTPLIDDYILKNNNDFWQTIKEVDCPIPLIITGHVHNDYIVYENNTEIITCPSTAFQFPKDVIEFTVEKTIGFNIWYFSENTYEKETVYL